MKTKNIKPNRLETAGNILILLALILFSIKCISAAMTLPFSFDGAIFVQIAQNLAERGAYAMNYGLFKASGMTIGITMSAPVASMFKIAGQGFTQGLLVNAFYMIMLMLVFVYYLKKCLNLNSYLVLLGVIIFAGTPGLFDSGFGLYGELPMLFYMAAGLVLFCEYEKTGKFENLFFAGLLWGCGLLTKTVFLIMLPGLIFVLLWSMAVKLKNFKAEKNYSRGIISLVTGFLAPNLIFEAYKFIIYGFKVHLETWKWYIFGAAAQAGVIKVEGGLQDTFGFFNKTANHLNLLGSYTGLGTVWTVILLCLLLAVFMSLVIYGIYGKKNIKKKAGQPGNAVSANASVILLMAVALSYFGWWIFITPTARAWHRRIFDGILLYEIAFPVILYFIYTVLKSTVEKHGKKASKYFQLTAVTVLMMFFLGAGAGLVRSGNHIISFKDTQEKTDLLAAGSFIKSLPNEAVFYGFNWWQAPNVSFTAHKSFKNIFTDDEMKTTGMKNEKYLVLDREALKSESICISKMLSDYQNKLVFENREARVYKLENRLKVVNYDECGWN